MTSDYEPTRWGRLASILLIATLITWQQVIM